jgi:hypothetical protein
MDRLNAYVQILNTLVFLLVSSVAGIGFTISLSGFEQNIPLQCIVLCLGVSGLIFAYWCSVIWNKIQDLLNK